MLIGMLGGMLGGTMTKILRGTINSNCKNPIVLTTNINLIASILMEIDSSSNIEVWRFTTKIFALSNFFHHCLKGEILFHPKGSRLCVGGCIFSRLFVYAKRGIETEGKSTFQ
mmetsp:Transcript_10116/g.21695  ORF Transcript_10116/g.21695 Transcript_10116/m.21695 type:complete len:113 (+) Transcript_10116:803-1141(+)